MKMKSAEPTPAHLAFREEALALLKKHAGLLPGEELLAMAAHMLGQIIAMQDQRKFNSSTIMQLVAANIEAGNREVIGALETQTGGNA